MYRGVGWPEIFSVVRRGSGRNAVYEARVALDHRTFRRLTTRKGKAFALIDCLRHRLAATPGPTLAIVHNWSRGVICR